MQVAGVLLIGLGLIIAWMLGVQGLDVPTAVAHVAADLHLPAPAPPSGSPSASSGPSPP